MDTTTPTEAPRLPERRFPEMVPLPPRPVTQGGGPYAQHLRPRRCMSFGWSAFNPARVRSVGNGFRCFAIWLITLIRIASLAIGICVGAYGPIIVGIIFGSIIGVVSHHFVSLSLAFIHQARGERRCMGIRWKRWHLDAFLAFFVCAHTLHFLSEFLLARWYYLRLGGAQAIVWIILGMMIVALGLIAARAPERSGRGEEEFPIGM